MQIAIVLVVAGLVTMLAQRPEPLPPAPPAPLPTDRVILLPEPDGRPSAVVIAPGTPGEQRLDQPFQAARVSRDGQVSLQTESAAAVTERYGLLLAAQPPAPVSFVVYFRTGSSTELVPESQAVLTQIQAELARRPVPEIEVIGHTDRVGSLEANDALALQRAATVREILVRSGLAAERISTSGRGEREPLVPTADEVAEPRNRRVEISVR